MLRGAPRCAHDGIALPCRSEPVGLSPMPRTMVYRLNATPGTGALPCSLARLSATSHVVLLCCKDRSRAMPA